MIIIVYSLYLINIINIGIFFVTSERKMIWLNKYRLDLFASVNRMGGHYYDFLPRKSVFNLIRLRDQLLAFFSLSSSSRLMSFTITWTFYDNCLAEVLPNITATNSHVLQSFSFVHPFFPFGFHFYWRMQVYFCRWFYDICML